MTVSFKIDNWLIDPDDDAYLKGFSDVINEDAFSLDHPLYHYTTEAGLDGILRGTELWGTAIEYMDDPSEVRLSWDVSTAIAGSWRGKTLDFDRMMRVIPKWRESSSDVQRFIISFCSQPDYLLAWRAYAADSNGYCLEFTLEDVKTDANWYLARVEYNRTAHIEEVRRILSRLERAYITVDQTIHRQFIWQRTVSTAAMWLSLVAPTLKDPQYESEREWRLIKMRFDSEDDRTVVQYRLRGGEDVPYVARSLEGATPALTLSRVIAGARVSDAAIEAVKRVAAGRFPNCTIERSTLQFRKRGDRPG